MLTVTVDSAYLNVDTREIEIVERKGLGHPDTLADGIAEAISIAYSRHCLEQFAAVLHHNIDKLALIGGDARVWFGGGEVLTPVRLVLNGRMSDGFGGVPIDYYGIQQEAAKDYIRRVCPHFDVDKWLKFVQLTNSFSHLPTWFRPRSLDDVPDRVWPHANDTASCVGYWPLSDTERLVMELERFFYDADSSPRFDNIGQDIKIMAVRTGRSIDLTMCVPFIGPLTPSPGFYRDQLELIKSRLLAHARAITRDFYNITVHLNTADNIRLGEYYLLATGTALEGGEEGLVGRGNFINGLIPSIRPYVMEAPFGKNPSYHVGKVWGYLTQRIARVIHDELGCPACVFAVTRNGGPLRPPEHIAVILKEERNFTAVRQIVEREGLESDYLTPLIYEKAILPSIWRSQ